MAFKSLTSLLLKFTLFLKFKELNYYIFAQYLFKDTLL